MPDAPARRNEEVAAAFDEIAERLLLQGESWFKVRAYRQGAEAIRAAAEPVGALSAGGRLAKLPHLGKAIAEKTVAYLTTGSIPLLQRLRAETSDGLLSLLHEGLLPATVRALHERFGVDGPESLRAVLESGALDGDAALHNAVQSRWQGPAQPGSG